MALNKDFIVKNGLVVLAQGSAESTSTTTGAAVIQGGVGIGGNLNVAGGLTANGVNFLAHDDHVWYVADHSFAKDTNDGYRPQSAFRTIKYALSVASPGDTVFIEAGQYQEIFPLTIPQGVNVRGAGLREVYVYPTVATQANDAFLLNGETTISDFTVGGFYKPGWAFKWAPGAKVTTRSPYIERFTVLTRGSTTTPEDPYGFLAGDAGNGTYIDGSVVTHDSLYSTFLFNEATFIVPNATGLYMTNGARAELLNGFFYFADTAIQAEIGEVGFASSATTRLRLGGISGTFAPGDTLVYKTNTGTTIATATITTVDGDYLFFDQPSWGFKTAVEMSTSTQVVYSEGTSSATATSILLADYHEWGAELRCIGSAAVFGNRGVVANGTGTDLKLLSFNMSHVGSGGDLSDDISLVIRANEVIQTNGGKVYYQTVDQVGDFRVGDYFYVNQRTGDVSFGTATVALSELANLTITDGLNNTVLLPTSIAVGNLSFTGGNVQTSVGDLRLSAAGPTVVIADNTFVQGAFTATGISKFTNTDNAISTTTGAVQVAGGLSTVKDIWVGGNLNVTNTLTSATIANLFVTGNAFIPGGFTATSFTSTELTVVGPAALNQLTAQLTTLTSLTVLQDTHVDANFYVTGTSYISSIFGTTATFNTLTLNGTTQATTTQSGTLIVAGGVGVGKNLHVGGDTYLGGNLYVDGMTITVDSTTIQTPDKLIIVSSATAVPATANNSGIQVGPSTGYASFLYDGSNSWKSKGSLVPNGTYNIGSLTNPWNVMYGNTIYDNSNRVVTSVTPSAGLGIGILSTSSNGPAATFMVTNTGVLSLTAGTDTAVSAATGNVTVWDVSTLQSVTQRGNNTTYSIYINNGTQALNTYTGALRIEGGVGIGGAVYVKGKIYSNGAEVWTTGTLTDNIQLNNGAGYLTSSTVGLYGVSYISGGAGISVSANTGNVTVTNIGVVSLQGSTYIGISASSGSNVTLTNLGVQTLTAGTDTAVSKSTGTVTVWDISTLQSVTSRGATTNQPLAFTATNLSASTNSGQALVVSGGIGALAVYATNLYDNGNRVLTSVTPTAGQGIRISGVSTGSGNTSFTIQNFGVTATVGTTYLGVSASTGTVTFTNLGVQTLTAGTDTAVSANTGTITVWDVSTLQSVTGRGNTTPYTIIINSSTNSTSTNTGALQVAGGVGVAGDVYLGGNVKIIGQLDASTVVGSISTASHLAGGTTGSIPYQNATGRTSFIGIGNNLTILQSNGTTATWVTTSSLQVAAAQFAVTSTNVVGGFVSVTTGSFSGIVDINDATNASSTNSGALQVTGGIGLGGSVWAGAGLYDRGQRVVTTIVPTAGTAIGISDLISTGTTASFAITNLGVQALAGSTYLGVSGSTGSITLTNLGVQTLTGSSYLGVSAATGTITVTNLGVQTLTAGTDTAVSANTGTITVWNTATLQSTTVRGAITNQAIQITNITQSNATSSGALIVAGGLGVGGNINVGGRLSVEGQVTFTSPVIFNGTATYVYSTNTWYTDNMLDLHVHPSGPATIWPGDDGKDIGVIYNYYNRGQLAGTKAALVLKNSSQLLEWFSLGSENTTTNTFSGTNYGGFKLGFIQLTSATVASSTATGALIVEGGVGIGGKLYVGGLMYSQGNEVITSASLGNFGVSRINPGPYISISPATGTGTVTVGNLGVHYISVGSGLSATTSTGTVILANVDTLNLVTSRGSTSSYAIQLNNLTPTSAANTGALVVAGGVGVGGGIYVNGVSTFTNTIYGTITTASNIAGGTGGGIPYQVNAGATTFLSIGGAGNVLTSNGTSPIYVTTTSLYVGNAIYANTATNIAGGQAGALAYQSGVGQTAFVGGAGTTGRILVSNGASSPIFQNTLTLAGGTQATNTNTGALIVQGGVGIWNNLYVGGGGWFNGSPVVTAANLGNYGVAWINAGTGISVNANTGTVTVTNIGVTATIGTTYLGVSAATGAVTFTNLGVQTLTAGSGTTVSASTGQITVSSIDTLQLVTNRGSTTTNIVYLTNATAATSNSTGALQVTGGIAAAAASYFGNNVVVRSGLSVNTSTINASYAMFVNGSFAATTKSFLIDHPTKPGKQLRYGSLEGPENGVYVRGRLSGTSVIELPDYWTGLVDPNSITVDLTPIGKHQKLYVQEIKDNKVYVGNENIWSSTFECFYTVWAERNDVEKLQVEID